MSALGQVPPGVVVLGSDAMLAPSSGCVPAGVVPVFPKRLFPLPRESLISSFIVISGFDLQ